MRNRLFTILTAVVVVVGHPSRSAAAKTVVLNSYDGVEWASCGRFAANLHTHTTESDGWLSPSEVIDRYRDMGYRVLALTDHNEHTWPWSNWDRDPATEGMVGIPGCEASRHDHLNSFFCDYDGSSGDVTTSLSIIADKGGLAQLNHPGRYSRSTSWYRELYDAHDVLVAMEVYNQGDRYSGDRGIWDDLLAVTMPDRPVWGTSCDDMHRSSHLFRNWNVFLTPGEELGESSIRDAFATGRFYACYDPSGTQSNAVALDSLVVTEDTIRVYADSEPSAIHWISDGQEVAQGAALCLASTDGLGGYVRAEIHGAEGARTLTQPLGLGESITAVARVDMPRTKPAIAVTTRGIGRSRIRLLSEGSGRGTLFDLSGRLLVSGILSAKRPLEVSHAPTPAHYVLRVDVEGREMVRRLILR